MRKKPSFTAMLSGASVVGIAVILAVTLIPSPEPVQGPQGIGVTLSMDVPDHRLSSAELIDPTRAWTPLRDASVTAHSQYAYVQMEIANTGNEDRSLVIQNDTRNYFTALLARDGMRFKTRYRQGDPVPSGESPLRHIRAAFPVTLRAGESETFILEYMNERDIVIDPVVRDSSDWFTAAGSERDMVTFIAASVLCLTLLNLIAGIMLFRPELVRMSFLTFSLLFFFIRQSRLLLILCDPLPYAPWLFPLSIGFELVSAHIYFGYMMGKNFMPWQQWSYRILSILTVVLVTVSFFFAAFTVADILNVLAMITLVIVLVGVMNALRRRDIPVLQTMLAFAPWISMMAVEIVVIYVKPRQIYLADYRQAFGMLLSLILVTIANVRNREYESARRIEQLSAELSDSKRNVERGIEAERKGRETVRSALASDCEPSLAGIFAAAGTLQREYSEPGVVAATEVIVSEASRVADILGSRGPVTGSRP